MSSTSNAQSPSEQNGINGIHKNGDASNTAVQINGPSTPKNDSQLPNRHPETGIDVLIVGAGIGGLMSALECWRKGHNVVRILERGEGPVYTGDIIIIQPSAMSVFRHWPSICREIEDIQIHVGMNYVKHTGEHIYGPCPPSFNDPENKAGRLGPPVAPAQTRVNFYKMLLGHVKRLGIQIDYGKRVKEYFEDEMAGKGGVNLEDGQKFSADITIAADGSKSPSQVLINGGPMEPKSSGMAIYRTAYPVEYAMKDETVRKRWESSDPVWEFWLGPGMYMGVFLSKDTVCWGFTPRDDGTAKESWNPNVDPEQALIPLQTVQDWHPAIPALIRTAPKGSIVHSPLLWRDLRREWTTPGGHVVQVGDSAHAFTPTSGNGATQAMEDATTLATCLQLGGGRRNATLAARIFNLLRYERVSCAQKLSFVNSQLKQETAWDAIAKDPSQIRTRFPKWIYKHDPETYAYDKYGQAFAHLVTGSSFQNTNFPPGHKFVPWTVDEVIRDMENGKRVEDLLDGDWS